MEPEDLYESMSEWISGLDNERNTDRQSAVAKLIQNNTQPIGRLATLRVHSGNSSGTSGSLAARGGVAD